MRRRSGPLGGRNAIVTGAGTGIGRATAVRLAAEGARVALLGRRVAPLRGTLKMLPGSGHLFFPCDVSVPEQVEDAAASLRKLFRRLDVLVSNAGVSSSRPALSAPFADWNLPMAVNFYGAVNCCRSFAPMLRRGGRIIFVTSIHHERVERGGSAYAASKAAAGQYARALALELADRNILVNVVAPGFVDTPMSVIPGKGNELGTKWFRDNYVKGGHLPLKRAGKPKEIASVIAFLAGPDSSYITGSILTVDGGLTITF